jgi:hypothetical protein
MFTKTLFTVAKKWTQPKCPPTGEWMKKYVVCGILVSRRKEPSGVGSTIPW